MAFRRFPFCSFSLVTVSKGPSGNVLSSPRMCSIHGLPTPGSEVMVDIRRVNPNPNCGLVELWVNIVGTKHTYEPSKERAPLPKNKFCGSGGKTGDLCLVCIADMWHRARIVSIKSDTCEVFLIDQGQPHVSTWDALAWGESDSFFLPPEIESCILANVLSLKEKWSKKASEFLTFLAGKTLKGVVQHVLMPNRTILLDIPLVSKQMCTIGAMRKIPADDFKGVVIECLTSPKEDLQEEDLSNTENGVHTGNADTLPSSDPGDFNAIDCQRLSQSFHREHVLSVGTTVDVTVSCVKGPQKFWCQNTKNGESLRQLMEGLQSHYNSDRPLPIVELACVTRNPDDGMWYRAKIVTSRHPPEVDVQFLDYGGTRRVPLGDVFPIDPAFLELEAQAFQCCLVNSKANSSLTASASAEFQRFLTAGDSQHTGFKCVVKDRTCDEEGRPLHVVDLETASQSPCNVLSLLPMDTYNYSTYDMELGTKEKAWVTSSETVHNFFCQLNKNSYLFNRVMADIHQLVRKSQCSSNLVGCHALCLARYSDNEWYRGKVVQTSPELKVLFVDYGDTLAVNASDVRLWPASVSVAKSIPVLAVALGLFGVPAEVPQEVNQWFADLSIGLSVTVSVVDKDDGGKLMVELFEGLLNVNVIVREKVAHAKRAKTSQDPQANKDVCSKQVTTQDEDFLTEELSYVSKLNQDKDQNGKAVCAPDGPWLERPPYQTLTAIPESEHEKILNEESTQPLIVSPKVLAETPEDIRPNDAERLGPERNFAYHTPFISRHKSEEVYASCIVGPSYFWCQFAHTENLNAVFTHSQSIGKALQDTEIPESLNPGTPCLALFPTDSQWYRAQVVRRNDSTVCVLFVDYGNESEVDMKDLRYLPCSLIEYPPQAFLCSLDGFDESKGSWDDQVYDNFYNLLVDKPLAVTVFSKCPISCAAL
ncbi:tudor domain-containing 6-like isoform X2 [Syngnathoides biaculeatus]|uniref:tudor domain-containing 6-like isoform X2 n=1 Tax=Syngnathoides biaculeatus TaxID=300417 RepID=UPI002ADDA173|nr:tudor domain-containing 6-like isoform X2 [Syngnathoides biaculeatus]